MSVQLAVVEAMRQMQSMKAVMTVHLERLGSADWIWFANARRPRLCWTHWCDSNSWRWKGGWHSNVVVCSWLFRWTSIYPLQSNHGFRVELDLLLLGKLLSSSRQRAIAMFRRVEYYIITISRIQNVKIQCVKNEINIGTSNEGRVVRTFFEVKNRVM